MRFQIKISIIIPALISSLLIINTLEADEPPPSSFKKIIAKSLKNSDKLKVIQKDIEEAERYLKLQYAQYYPKINIQGSLGVDLLRLNTFTAERNSSVNLVLDWDIFRNGQIRYAIESAQSNLRIKKLLKKDEETRLIYKIKEDCLNLFLKQENLKNVKTKFKIAQKELEQAEISYKQGNLNRASLLKHKIKLADQEIYLSQIKQNVAFLKKNLEEASQSKIEITPGYVAGLVEQAYAQELDLNRLIKIGSLKKTSLLIKKENETMGRLAEKFTKLQRLPKLQLFSGNAFALDDLGRSSNQLEFRTGMIVSYPLYDGGATSHTIETAKTNYEKAVLDYSRTKKELKNNIEKSYYQLIKNKKLEEISNQKLKLLEDDVTLGRKELEEGNISPYQWEMLELNYRLVKFKNTAFKVDFLLSLAQVLENIGLHYLAEIDEIDIKDHDGTDT